MLTVMLPLLMLLGSCPLGRASQSLASPVMPFDLLEDTTIPSEKLLATLRRFQAEDRGIDTTIVKRDLPIKPIAIKLYLYVVTGTEGGQLRVTVSLRINKGLDH